MQFLYLAILVHYSGTSIDGEEVFWGFGKMCEEVNKVAAIFHYPLSPQSDQHWFSPNNINTSSRKTVRRILKKVTKGKKLFKEMYEDQFEEFLCGYWGLKG